MENKRSVRSGLTAVICLLVLNLFIGVLPNLADEGMWTFDNPPTKLLEERYGFTPTQEWLDHVRLSSVRFMDGGSGSFVSPNGLIMTNHHVAVGQLQKISTPEKDYVASGLYAATPDQEIKCPDLEINVLVSMKNVTDKVRAVVKAGMSEEEFAEKLLFEEKVAVVPGNAFGAAGTGYVRAAYCTAYDKLEEALVRIERFLKSRKA